MRHLAPPFAIFAVGSIVGALIVFAGLFVRRPLWSGAGLAAIALFGSTLFAGTLKPESARARSMKTFAEQVHRRIGDAPLYIPWGHDYELSFYYGRGIWGLDHAAPPVLASDLAADAAGLRRRAAARAFAHRAGPSQPAETRDAVRPGRRRRPARAL